MWGVALVAMAWAGCTGGENRADDAATDTAQDSAEDTGQHTPRLPAVEATPAAPQPVAIQRAGEAERDQAAQADVEAAVRARRAAFAARYPHHGITTHFLARVRAQPSNSAPVAGYMRRGARFRATERVPGVGCRRGWFEVPGGGFVCRGEGFLIADEPPSFDPVPVPPALEDPLPYDYALTRRRDVPQYWRVPSEQEEATVTEQLRELGAHLRERDRAEGLADVDAPPAPGQQQQEEARVSPAPDDSSLPGFVRQRMRAGFYVSRDGRQDGSEGDNDGRVRAEDGRRFVRTVRGGLVREEFLEEPTPSTHHGIVLGGAWRLPLAFTLRDGTHRLHRIGTTRRFESAGTLPRHTALHVAEMVDRHGSSYVVDQEGYSLRRSAVRIAAAVARPARVREGHRWLHVSLSEQTLVAYEGDTPVYATTISSGKEGFETPTGLFRIQSKHVSTTMDDLTSEEGAYQIEDVPWTMYFEGNYALHTAFWHDQFGRTRSHGCVNLAPADARWVFHWAGPNLPTSWHGVFADRHREGTWVYITEE